MSQRKDPKDEHNDTENQDRQAEGEEDVEEEEQGKRQQRIVTDSPNVQSPRCGKLHGKVTEVDGAKSSRKRRCSTRLASSKKQMGPPQPFSNMRVENAAGKVLEVHGGRIIRSLGRKDRHSKVYTSKGPRDRRVRLSAHTAMQFYDVQDRLGYDRPSKAIDWLIDKAKAAIEALSELPKQEQTDNSTPKSEEHLEEQSTCQLHRHQAYHSELEKVTRLMTNASNVSAVAPTSSFSNQFQDYPAEENFKAPSFDIHHSDELESLSYLNATEMGRFQSLMGWHSNAGTEREEFVFGSLPKSLQQPVLSQNQLVSPSRTHQDSNFLSRHAWTNPLNSIDDHAHIQSPTIHSIPSTEFSSGGFLGI